MLNFMEYVQNQFYAASNWNRDNSYGTLTATSRNLLDFATPAGLRFHVSSLSSPSFATSYTLGSIGLVDGSLSYLYSSLPLASTVAKSSAVSLHHLVPGYQQLQPLRRPDEAYLWEIWQGGRRIDRRDALLYGRLFLPRSTLEALYLRRLSPESQLKVSCVSDSRLPDGGTILALFQHDTAKHSTEYLYSTDSALLGVRGLYNFGPEPLDPSPPTTTTTPTTTPAAPKSSHGRFSAGCEFYYGLLNKSGGASTGLRFATLPAHPGFPYTMTLTLNPLMGNLSSTYSVLASPLLTLSSRFDFNVYSYESDLQIGMELWRPRARARTELGWARRKMPSTARPREEEGEEAGVLKARIDQKGAIGVLWEGRVKELLVSAGIEVDLRGRGEMFRGVGVEVAYSS